MTATIASYAFLLEGMCCILCIGVMIGRNLEQHARCFADWGDVVISMILVTFAMGFFLGWKLL